ncbi:fumarate hydratase [Dethiobacter alkaliphilus]|uniref:Hydro-lyase, Fe-S type, tartrate/fumarate subfamily, alpha subunit n=1 Tax=Dethiobacter alkaliphilus AHT 1 TaxID=555088 RepID=C0GJW7_DETAL|nr:fumarate hydratase [Dethiobacter alkaliphilus]EEG76336.1 hydro-lyase, Fe-S type, tartrate/fumarate subfamily, alpha subunit [Dethiobacter alkaliphilus AHT 1]MCW3489838.1 fumarate hydratase [Dethiobacter alkaliphilus]
MREVNVAAITDAIAELSMDANYNLGDDVLKSFKDALEKETSPTGKAVLEQLIENAQIAKEEQVPMCQDTGYAVIFVELGQEVNLVGGDLYEAINEGVRRGYGDGYLRKSIVSDPINRVNTKDNTPAVVHVDIVPGDKVKVTIAPKGGGSENMSAVKMLKPSDGAKGVVDFVVEAASNAGSNPCPPIVIGVGIGGTFEKVAYLAKKALLRELGQPNPDPFYAEMEKELLEKINKLGIGPQGFGGRTTALAVHIETYPAHIASMPAAVNINCHAARHKERVI